MALSALAINCTLKASPADSSCELLLSRTLEELKIHGVTGTICRVVDYDIKPGVTSDEGSGDEWPAIRQAIMDNDILILGTPIWLGHHSSVCQRVLERMDAFLGELDDEGRKPAYGKVAAVVVVGNEDGAHHVVANLFQGLNDVGFTVPASCSTYWTGEAMHKTDLKDLPEIPEVVAQTTAGLAANCVHLANLLKHSQYPGQ